MSATSINDILIASDSKIESDRATNEINSKLCITDSRNAEWILGCRITRCQMQRLLMLMIDQAQFVSKILQEFRMEHCNAIRTPCPKMQVMLDMCPQYDLERHSLGPKWLLLGH